jgi:hypothetical protein
MNWQRGRWSEDRILEAINATRHYRAVPYGRSAVGPEERDQLPDYWEAYQVVESVGKRPDILVVPRGNRELRRLEMELGDLTLANDDQLLPFLDAAICGLEAENSLWLAQQMPDFDRVPLTRLDVIAPTIWIKEEDAAGLARWERTYRIPVLVVQVFLDRAFAASFNEVMRRVRRIRRAETVAGRQEANRLQKELRVRLKAQSFWDARSGTSATKMTFRAHHTIGMDFGRLDPRPRFRTRILREPNGKVIPYVAFEDGRLVLSREARALLVALARR